MTRMDIDMLYKAVGYYAGHGYGLVELPWIVDKVYTDITAPPNAVTIELDGGCLVASAEQSFLAAIAKKELPKGKYSCITPCFRFGDVVDKWHRKYFMKLELIDTTSDSFLDQMVNVKSMIDVARNFFRYSLNIDTYDREISTQPIQIDLDARVNDLNVELGSYGIREHPLIGKWIYGTGIAVPRTSLVKMAGCDC